MARSAPLLPPAPRSAGALIRYWITRTFSGRVILIGAAVKIAAAVLGLIFGQTSFLGFLDTVGDVHLVVGAGVLGLRLFVDLKQRLLWRVRRKLTVSYIFIGFVPALLIIIFFLVSGLLLFFNVAAYMTRREVAGLVDQTRSLAESAALLAQSVEREQLAARLAQRQAAAAERWPGVSVAIVPTPAVCDSAAVPATGPVTAGPWRHTPPPTSLPAWLQCGRYTGLITYPQGDRSRLAARAAVHLVGSREIVIVDTPLDDTLVTALREEIGVTIEDVMLFDPESTERRRASLTITTGADEPLGWLTFIEGTAWETGQPVLLSVSFHTGLRAIYDRVSFMPLASVTGGIDDFGQALLYVLAVVGVLFLVIQAVAFGMGLALARSITGSVHELFEGTERVRRGDFTGRVAIRSRDQLGELADSFNSMTSSIEDLLQQKAEKERLEQELRIARSIQMSLLPQGPMTVPGASVTAHCEPAREVGGDYYDFLPIDDHTIGILIADVSGKGTSAALYMAELKGIVLSLSQRHTSPRELLIEADHIISRHLDSRSFITVTYLVADLQAGVLRYARAGHCPLIYVPGPYAASREPQLMLPDGLVLGLQLDNGATFTRLLEEVTLPLGAGDLFLLYTDGISEAMNAAGECFGDARLAAIVGAHADLPADELRERILREISAFAGSAPQHDDMTMVLLRVEQVGAAMQALLPVPSA